MAKWADYCISAVRYDDDGKHISKVRVHVDNGDAIGTGAEWMRKEVVSSMSDDKTFVTMTKGPDDKWCKGASVHTVTVNRVKYIRTDNNDKASDNLENLPEL